MLPKIVQTPIIYLTALLSIGQEQGSDFKKTDPPSILLMTPDVSSWTGAWFIRLNPAAAKGMQGGPLRMHQIKTLGPGVAGRLDD